MANVFPSTTNLAFETSLPLNSAKRAVVFEDNSSIVQGLASNDIVLTGRIVCPFLTEQERDDTMSFYQTNKDLLFEFLNPHDDIVYNLKFIDPTPTPNMDSNYSPPRYIITFTVIGEKQ